jgi:dihydroneopterin aldolase
MKNQTKIFIRDFKIDALVGIFPGDEINPTPLSISIEVVFEDYKVETDDIESTMSYVLLVDEVYKVCKRHFKLVEKMADHLAAFCLSHDRVSEATIRIEKTKMFAEGFSGTEITRCK